MDWIPTLLIIPRAVVVLIVWDLLLAGLLRPWIRLSLFRFRKGQETQTALSGLGADAHILVAGLLQFGWPMFVAMSLGKYLSAHYLGQLQEKPSARGLIVMFLVWTVCGIWVGYASWSRKAPRNDDEATVRQR